MSFDRLRELRDKYKKFAVQEGRQAILDSIKEFFQRFPQVEKIGFRGYTPEYCDGDPCTFRISGIEYKEREPQEKIDKEMAILEAEAKLNELKGIQTKTKARDRDDDDRMDDWYRDYQNRELVEAARELTKPLEEFEDVLRLTFGENHQVIVLNDPDMTVLASEYTPEY